MYSLLQLIFVDLLWEFDSRIIFALPLFARVNEASCVCLSYFSS